MLSVVEEVERLSHVVAFIHGSWRVTRELYDTLSDVQWVS